MGGINLKKDNIIKVIISVIVIAIFSYIAIFGVKIGGKTIIKSVKEIKTGLDISGGVTIVYQATAEEGTSISEQDLKKSEAVIRKRLESKNIQAWVLNGVSRWPNLLSFATQSCKFQGLFIWVKKNPQYIPPFKIFYS